MISLAPHHENSHENSIFVVQWVDSSEEQNIEVNDLSSTRLFAFIFSRVAWERCSVFVINRVLHWVMGIYLLKSCL